MAKPIQITGFPEIDRKLKLLEPKVAKKMMRKALRDSQKQMTKQVKQNAPTDEGDLKKAVKTRAGKRSRKRASVYTTFKTEGLEDFYPRFIEFGAPEAGIQPNPFMREAFEQKKNQVQRAAEAKLGQLVEDEVKKL